MDNSSLWPSWIDLTWNVLVGAGLVYFFRDRLAVFLDARAHHTFDLSLEQLKAELAKKSKEIGEVRSALLVSVSQRRNLVDQKQLESIDQIWNAVRILAPIKFKLSILSVVKFEAAAEEAKRNADLRKVFITLFGGIHDKNSYPVHQAHEARLYVTSKAWVLFSAYQAILTDAFARCVVLCSGVGADALRSAEYVLAITKEALPDWTEYLDKFGTASFESALDEIERRLLTELRQSVRGDRDDDEYVARAARITSMIAKGQADSKKQLAREKVPSEELV